MEERRRRYFGYEDESSSPLTADNLAQYREGAQQVPQPTNRLDIPEETCPAHPPASTEQILVPIKVVAAPTPKDGQFRANDLRLANILMEQPRDPIIDNYIARYVFTTLENQDDAYTRLIAARLFIRSNSVNLRPPLLQVEWDQHEEWRSDLEPVHAAPPSPLLQYQQTIQQTYNQTGNSTSPDRAGGPSTTGFELERSCPCICVGLTESELTQGLEHRRSSSDSYSMLSELQESSALITDPHATPMHVNFPFLIIETTSHIDGSLYQAQNKAALCGSRAIRILEALSEYHEEHSSFRIFPAPDELPFNLAFSITVKGPIWEVWLHHRRAGDTASEPYAMVFLAAGNTGRARECLSLVRIISDIMRWGSGVFAAKIKSLLREIDLAGRQIHLTSCL
ncbi:hypothetical protein BDQ94DRAFT_167959 [Aspergillus welwitschiae]|uniref:Uncharacterized protein n=1 Tax=Aspergillus welwitschiae TaxID=1341132 RepID=A0A3F3QAT4_9EURO|nr:hypothetical protein BDQ94DRAFT_167959 [Aspergillus welwitschiae]RDH36344.1 hypothetical protein BDQ94DRAFT_167959 [Aspergillus welwitschiae]